MKVRPLEEDLRRMGLSNEQIRSSLSSIGMLTEGAEADFEDDDSGEEFEEAYLSDLVDDDDDEIDEMRVQRMKKSSAKEKRASKKYYKSHKASIGRKRKKQSRNPAWQRHMAKLAKAPKASGSRVRRVMSDIEVPTEGHMSEGILENLAVLAESIDRDPKSRFDEYVEAFNYIADLGEILAMRALEEDENEAASDVLDLSLGAEAMLKEMEEMGGALTPDEDEYLEEALDDAMEDVEEVLEAFGVVGPEDEEDEDEDEDEDEEEATEGYEYDDEDGLFEAAAKKYKMFRGKKVIKRPKLKGKGVGIKVGKGKSAYSKISLADRKAIIDKRSDFRKKKAMIAYLGMVKRKKIKPGQSLS